MADIQPQDFLTLLAECELIALSDNTPLEGRRAFAGLADHFDKCAWFIPKTSRALATHDAVYFHPTNRFLSLMAAARANDWVRVVILVHEISTLPLEPYQPPEHNL